MNLSQKLQILGESAKYDASCASSGSNRANLPNGIGNTSRSGICHSWSEDGRCISLLKILQTNICVYDCAYCSNRRSHDLPRAFFSPEEIAELTINFYERNYIEGLFLSSAVYKSPDYTMELMIKSLELLRLKNRFNGYIHVKSMPGASAELIKKAGLLADRISVNIELPSKQSLSHLAPQKTSQKIFKSMAIISENISTGRSVKKTLLPSPYQHNFLPLDSPSLFPVQNRNQIFQKNQTFAPAGQSTQLIIGASPENDRSIILLTEALYKKFYLKRVYYSAFIPAPGVRTDLPQVPPPLRRENRLYQADWLIRFYGFSAKEILDEDTPDLDMDIDPKSSWALKNRNFFPIEIQTADYEDLLRVPGVGILSAKKIIKARAASSLSFVDLKNFGVVLKRAKYFITCNGKCLEKKEHESAYLKNLMAPQKIQKEKLSQNSEQLLLFPDLSHSENPPGMLQELSSFSK